MDGSQVGVQLVSVLGEDQPQSSQWVRYFLGGLWSMKEECSQRRVIL